MEWKKLLYGCVGLFAACALAGCGKEEEENLQYLNLSDIACTFTGEDNLPFTVTVYAYADWTAGEGRRQNGGIFHDNCR